MSPKAGHIIYGILLFIFFFSADYECINCWEYLAITCGVSVVVIIFSQKTVRMKIMHYSRVFSRIIRRNQTYNDENETLCALDKDTEMKPLYSKCTLCDRKTAFAFCCDCQGFYCETCANNHVVFKDHHIIQIRQFQSKHKTKCYNCTKQYPNMVCRECAHVFCSDCVRNCGHSHDSNLVKQLIITEPISIEPVLSINSEYKSEVLRKKYKVPESSNAKTLFTSDSDISTASRPRCSNCETCARETAFAFCCDCQGVYCETCANNHVNFKAHNVIQIKQIQSKNKTKCFNCTNKYPNMVCRKCANVFCSDCVHRCGHSHDSNLVKQLIITEPISIKPVISTKSEYKSEVLRNKYNVPISSNTSETRIRGIAFLESGQFVLADYKARQLKIFSDTKLDFTVDLTMEPRGLTGITRNRVAVTFAYEKKIILYDIKQLCVKKYDEINLKDIGKPFQIAFHNNFFVVEVNEGEDGRIVLLNQNGAPMHVIPNNNWEFGYFTGNTLRLQLDMIRNEIYVTAIGKKAVYCLNFIGEIKWYVRVPSPRSLVVLPNTHNNTTTLLLASHKASMIYKLICTKNKSDNKRYDHELIEMVNEKQIEQPDYMAYDHENHLMYTEVSNGRVSVYDMISQQHCQ